MSNFTPRVEETVEFDGDTITYTSQRLKKVDMAMLKPLMPEPDENGKVVMSISDNVRLIDATIGLLPKYVSNFRGLTAKDGSTIDLEHMLGEAYFYSLQSDMASRLLKASFVNEDDEKNSGVQSDEVSKESTSIETN